MKCKVQKIIIIDFESPDECENYSKNVNAGKIYMLHGKYRLIYKANSSETFCSGLKNSYLEYFKTLEYGKLVKVF